MSHLVDPSLLKDLNEDERKEALAAAAAAQRAEERAERRALERALQRKEMERKREVSAAQRNISSAAVLDGMDGAKGGGIVFVPKKKRNKTIDAAASSHAATSTASSIPAAGRSTAAKQLSQKSRSTPMPASSGEPNFSGRLNPSSSWNHKEKLMIQQTYLGTSALDEEKDELEREKQKQKRKRQLKVGKKALFKFRWEDTDDTFDAQDPLYNGTFSGVSSSQQHRQQQLNSHKRKHPNSFSSSLSKSLGEVTDMQSVMKKPLAKMTARDWRIVRENLEIVVRGGKAPPPLRTFHESPLPGIIPILHPSLLSALTVTMGFKDPTPIQRQAIPIGLQRRDLIGIAETGSGKTVAFGVPLCHYLLHLPNAVLQSVADEGPLALIMAPTRELALQIDSEMSKLLSTCKGRITTFGVVGGQSIQNQAAQLRKGVHVVVGTPGRINECIEMAYMVLNQCCYIVLDEADRMVDMGFRPQIESIFSAMGGTLKSELAAETYQQESDDLKSNSVAKYRLTSMFSATMPQEVEQLAKQYLRNPAKISIGDPGSSSRNARIVQRLVWLSSPSRKEEALRVQISNPQFARDKIIVFVNEKKHADAVGRIVERANRQCVVLHGGKSQEEREYAMDIFRRGGVVLVATDVAGRGLDIPDVAHVINYDLPSRSIESYTHRIGRTGRAGKEGLATSFITDEDEGIMAALKQYLESTNNAVPDRLRRHPAAASASSQNEVLF